MKGKWNVKLSLTAVAAIAVLALFAGGFFLGFSTRKAELRDDHFVLVGPQIRATRIISREKLPPERYPLMFTFSDLDPLDYSIGAKGDSSIDGKGIDHQAITALDNAEYVCSFWDERNYARIIEKVCQGKRTVMMDYDLSGMVLPRKMNADEVGVLQLVGERELQIIEQDIYLDYRKGVNSEFKTIQYVVCPFTKLSAECVVIPKSDEYR